jgi:hypothetical protein
MGVAVELVLELTAEPKKGVWGTMAKFKDPDGNELVFSSR